MKNIIKTGLIVALSLFIFQPVQGQALLKKLQKKVEEKIEDRAEESVNKQVDKQIDKRIDSAFDKLDESLNGNDSASTSGTRTDEERMSSILKGIGVSGEPVPFEDNYAFDNLIQMHIENYTKAGKLDDTGDINIHFAPDSKSMAYEIISGDFAKNGQGLFIVDAENGAMIILSEDKGKKSGIVYGMGAFFQSIGQTYNQEEVDLSDSPETYLANPHVTKTGRTKTISGYKCEEFKYNDESTESEIWITRDLKMNSQDFLSTLFQTSMYANGMGWGYPMEVTSIEKNSGEKSVMQVTKVDNNSNVTFSMKDYQITNLGSFTMPQETDDDKK